MGLFSNSSASQTTQEQQIGAQGPSGSGGAQNIIGAESAGNSQAGGLSAYESNLNATNGGTLNITTNDPLVAEEAVSGSNSTALAALTDLASALSPASLAYNAVPVAGAPAISGAAAPDNSYNTSTASYGVSLSTILIGGVVLLLGLVFLIHRR